MNIKWYLVVLCLMLGVVLALHAEWMWCVGVAVWFAFLLFTKSVEVTMSWEASDVDG
jgi:hypothetical protein